MKYIKRLLFWLFILVLIVIMCYLGVQAYTQANASRAINYLVEKYEVKEKQLKALKYQEYVYEDIANCDSLWIKKCTSEETLKYSYTIEHENGTKIVVKEDKDGSMVDDYDKGTIRKSYLDKLDKMNGINKDTIQNESTSNNNQTK